MELSLQTAEQTPPEAGYLYLPKGMGEVPADHLLAYAKKHELYANTASTPLAASRHNLIAGSLKVEAMITAPNDDWMSVDERISYINSAHKLIFKSARLTENAIHSGAAPIEATVDLERTELQLTFMDAYIDMTCGEVSELTTEETLAALKKHVEETQAMIRDPLNNDYHRSIASGLLGELLVLYDYWRQRKANPSGLIAIPATPRGDDGSEYRKDSHDIVFFEEIYRDNQPNIYTPYATREVKTGRAAAGDIQKLGRYVSGVLKVSSDKNLQRRNLSTGAGYTISGNTP